jgi:hypothetical protein
MLAHPIGRVPDDRHGRHWVDRCSRLIAKGPFARHLDDQHVKLRAVVSEPFTDFVCDSGQLVGGRSASCLDLTDDVSDGAQRVAPRKLDAVLFETAPKRRLAAVGSGSIARGVARLHGAEVGVGRWCTGVDRG